MGKHESLKDLQTRLAERLSIARRSDSGKAWLAVTAGHCNYLLSLLQAGEILSGARLHAVPRTEGWFMGVLNIRGNFFSAVKLSQFIAQSLGPAVEPRPQTQQLDHDDEQSRFITLNPSLDVNCALHVDCLVGLRGANFFESSIPREVEAPTYFGDQFIDAKGKVWQELDVQVLAQTPQFININAESGKSHGHSKFVS